MLKIGVLWCFSPEVWLTGGFGKVGIVGGVGWCCKNLGVPLVHNSEFLMVRFPVERSGCVRYHVTIHVII